MLSMKFKHGCILGGHYAHLYGVNIDHLSICSKLIRCVMNSIEVADQNNSSFLYG